MTKGEIAKKYFECGKNCSQAVALAFCPEMGLRRLLKGKQSASAAEWAECARFAAPFPG